MYFIFKKSSPLYKIFVRYSKKLYNLCVLYFKYIMIYYISGGERSGKSSYAQQLAESLSNTPIYIATSRIWDEDFRKRVDRHIAERDQRWTTIEEEKWVSKKSDKILG